MTPRSALAAWAREQTCLLRLAAELDERDLRRVWHRDISPIGWHVGHTTAVSAYWIREVVSGGSVPDAWKALYFPERCPKPDRPRHLPPRAELLAWSTEEHQRDLALLSARLADGGHPLLRDAYLAVFLAQHSGQHRETVRQALLARRLSLRHGFPDTRPCATRAPAPPECRIEGGRVEIGHAGGPEAYDNELPRHRVSLAPYRIAARPVSNAEYLGFMASGGYRRRDLWSAAGWRWRERANVNAPLGWIGRADRWYVLDVDGPAAWMPEHAVCGINYFEAEAYARYAGARLPSEHEWEYARSLGAIRSESVAAWEWCANRFYPYPGFRAFPYDGYSPPWFDGAHYVLRGASRHTATCLRRPSFRNFYTPDKRHVFAGLRLARDDENVATV